MLAGYQKGKEISSNEKIIADNEIFVDRDPEVFSHIITYLRSGKKFLPQDASADLKTKIDMEIMYW